MAIAILTRMLQAVREEDGATMVEYVLLLSFIVLTCAAAIKTYGLAVANKMAGNSNSVSNALQ